jgi:hypothetical protein
VGAGVYLGLLPIVRLMRRGGPPAVR